MNRPTIRGEEAGLFTDFYQLTMAQAYLSEGMTEDATFSLFFRDLPDDRNFVIACGLEDALDLLEDLEFSDSDIEYLQSQEIFSEEFLDYLETFAFDGRVFAVREGTPVFPEEPLVEVVAPAPQAQIVETLIMNQIHYQSVLATKAARVVDAAGDATVLDFGARRIYGTDAALKAARAYYVAGMTGTSLVLAGKQFGVPVSGTMAHSYIQAHDDEYEAFKEFAGEFPETVLLVDTYDTVEGVKKVAALSEDLGEEFAVRGIRLDSGDLGELARTSREVLDEARLEDVEVFASGGLDEYAIAELVEMGAPIDGYGVGTNLATSEDAPKLDIAYKLTAYAGKGRMKLQTGKSSLPGRKQVWRRYEDGEATGDILGRPDEEHDGEPLLERVMVNGERVENRRPKLDDARERRARMLDELPDRYRSVHKADPEYEVVLSDDLEEHAENVQERLERTQL